MTWDEWKPISALLSAGVGKSWEKFQVRVWCEFLQDLPAGIVEIAVRTYLAEAEFPGFPPPGAIRKRALVLVATEGRAQNAEQAWELAMNAARNSCEYDAERTIAASKTLDPITRAVLKGFGGLRGLMITTNISVIRSQFLKAWEQAVKTEAAQALLPSPERLRGLIGTQPTAPVKRLAAAIGT